MCRKEVGLRRPAMKQLMWVFPPSVPCRSRGRTSGDANCSVDRPDLWHSRPLVQIFSRWFPQLAIFRERSTNDGYRLPMIDTSRVSLPSGSHSPHLLSNSVRHRQLIDVMGRPEISPGTQKGRLQVEEPATPSSSRYGKQFLALVEMVITTAPSLLRALLLRL